MLPVAAAVNGSAASRGAGSVLVLSKARQILDAFTPQQAELTAREVQRRTALPPSTCLRLLHTLVAEGFLDRRGDAYRPGLALLRWGQAATAGLDLIRLAAPVLAQLRDRTGETACLFVRDGAQHICVAVTETPHAVVHILRVGQVLPLHAGSAGRVFLAYEPDGTQLLASLPLPALTPHTLTDREQLRGAVEQARRQGFAATFEERSIGAASLSAPVVAGPGAAGGPLAGVLGIVSPIQRFSPDRVPAVSPHVVTAAGQLSGHAQQVAGRT